LLSLPVRRKKQLRLKNQKKTIAFGLMLRTSVKNFWGLLFLGLPAYPKVRKKAQKALFAKQQQERLIFKNQSLYFLENFFLEKLTNWFGVKSNKTKTL
jgi:hypothetical protein